MQIDQLRAKHFPYTTRGGFTVRASTREEVTAVAEALFERIYPQNGEHARFVITAARREAMKSFYDHYSQLHHEWLLFCLADGTPMGWMMGEMDNHNTFYMRNTGVLPEYQGQGIYKELLEHMIAYLGELGYERISSHHLVTNNRIIITKLKQGFYFAGLELTEQWGPMAKLVKILVKDREDSFITQYGRFDHRQG
ncbi:MAG TPA: GNAT family N-acetyltransferase [Bdellovibrionota bacterium]|jgi:GNAT superfamily N-acetyltransferase|nr:GNAT family N-acetyltransferase [Bdellovibrionota bacterium]